MIKLIANPALPPELRQRLEALCAEANGPDGKADRDRVASVLQTEVRARELARRRSAALIGLPAFMKRGLVAHT